MTRGMRALPASVLTAAAILCACSKIPGGVIEPDTMSNLLADIYIGETVIDQLPQSYLTDSSRRVLQQSIYMKHGVTAAEFDSSLYWYGQHLDEYMEVCRNTEKILQQRIDHTEKLAGQTAETHTAPTSIDGDSVNLWKGTPYRRTSVSQASDYATFVLHTDKNWERGDRYTISVTPLLASGPVTLSLAADYNDGTTEYNVKRITPEAGAATLRLVLDSAKVATSVYGYILYTPREGEVSYLDSITLVRTRGQNDNVAARRGQMTTRH